MKSYSLTGLPDRVLLRELRALVVQDRATTAALLAHLAEVDARRLFAPAGYDSLFAYCVGELGFSEESAYKRIQAARTARRFPEIYAHVRDGRLHVSAVVLLAPHLAAGAPEELLAACGHKSTAEIRVILAERFPRPDLAASVRVISPACASQPITEPTPPSIKRPHVSVDPANASSPLQLDSNPVGMTHPEPLVLHAPPVPQVPPSRLTPLSPQRFGLQVTVGQATFDKLRHAQALLAHSVPSGDLEQLLDRALAALIRQLEHARCAATDRPQASRASASTNPRHVPASVRRAVWARDGGQCTFVSDKGHRCASRSRLEIDHVLPVARGGRTSLDGLRLRCRTHNQHAADCVFGRGFMDRKRNAARERVVVAGTGRHAP